MKLARVRSAGLIISDSEGAFSTLHERSDRALLEVMHPINTMVPLLYDREAERWADIVLPDSAVITGRVVGAEGVLDELGIEAWFEGEPVASVNVGDEGFFEIEAPLGEVFLRAGNNRAYPIRSYAIERIDNPGPFCVVDLSGRLRNLSVRLPGLEGESITAYIFEGTEGDIEFSDSSNWRECEYRVPSDGVLRIDGISRPICGVRVIAEDGVTGAWTGLLESSSPEDFDAGTVAVGHFRIVGDPTANGTISAWAPNVPFYEAAASAGALMLPPGPWALLAGRNASSFNGATWLTGQVGEEISAVNLMGHVSDLTVQVVADGRSLLGVEIALLPEGLSSRVPGRPMTKTRLSQDAGMHTFRGVAAGRYVVDVRLANGESMRQTVDFEGESKLTIEVAFQRNTQAVLLNDFSAGRSVFSLIALDQGNGAAFDGAEQNGDWRLPVGLDGGIVVIIWLDTMYGSTRFGSPVTYATLKEVGGYYEVVPQRAELEIVGVTREDVLWAPRLVIERIGRWHAGSLTWGMEQEVGGDWASDRTFSFSNLPPLASGYIYCESESGKPLRWRFSSIGDRTVFKFD